MADKYVYACPNCGTTLEWQGPYISYPDLYHCCTDENGNTKTFRVQQVSPPPTAARPADEQDGEFHGEGLA